MSAPPAGRSPAAGSSGADAAPPAPPRRPRSWLLTQLMYLLVLCGVAAGVAVIAADHFKRGGAMIAASVLVAALARLVLPEDRVGLLAVRSRLIDVVTLTTLAVTLGMAAVLLPPSQ